MKGMFPNQHRSCSIKKLQREQKEDACTVLVLVRTTEKNLFISSLPSTEFIEVIH